MKRNPKSSDALAAYWAGSISASVAADVAAGNVRTVVAGARTGSAARTALRLALRRTRVGTSKVVMGIAVEKVAADAYRVGAWGTLTLAEAVDRIDLGNDC